MSPSGDGERKSLSTSWGAIEYRETGSGRPVLFVHGILANGTLWEHVVARLPADLRLIRLDLPLGGHRIPAPPAADMTLPSLAGLVLEVVEILELEDVTLVGNDTGGALCQVVVTRADARVARIARLLLTNCDAFEVFPPTSLAVLRAVVRPAPSLAGWLTAQLTRTAWGRRFFMWLVAASRRPDGEAVRLLGGFLHDPAVRRDAVKLLLAMDRRHTLEAAARFGEFDRPVRLLWGTRDLFFPVSLAERLEKAFPRAKLERAEGAKLFVSLDQPEREAETIAAFVTTA
jgi:pimeloyl-ACP methyl ester carboxylesterase